MGDVPLTSLTLGFTVANPSSELAQEANVCIGTTGVAPGATFSQLYDGPLSGLVGQSFVQSGTPLLVPTSTDSFIVNFYAGRVTTACGAESVAPLGTVADWESVPVTINVAAQG